ncbi:MAG TPA: hypothetical protein VGL05_19765 [Kribbella sp.]
MPRNDMNPNHWSAFLQVIETVPAGHHASSNVLRDLLNTADIPEKSRGGLFAQAVKNGYLRPVGSRYEASNGETAHRAPVRLYRRTKKQQEVAA